MHDELGLVVERAEVGEPDEIGGDRHRVDDRVERGAGVHHREGVGDEALERRGHVVEHRFDALPTGDRQAVGGHEELGTVLDHLAERGRPFDGVALDLLRVARVGEVPDDEVADHRPPSVGEPGPQMVVGLAPGVVQFDALVADLHDVSEPERLIRRERVGGQEPLGPASDAEVHLGPDTAELTGVDDQVPVVRQLVAGEAGVDVLVADHPRPLVAAGTGIGGERTAAADVIGVPVRVDERMDRRRRPPADALDDRRPGVHPRRVEAHEPLVGAEGNAVAEALDHRQVVGELGQLVRHPVDGLVEHPVVDDPARQPQQVPHPPQPTPNSDLCSSADTPGPLENRDPVRYGQSALAAPDRRRCVASARRWSRRTGGSSSRGSRVRCAAADRVRRPRWT